MGDDPEGDSFDEDVGDDSEGDSFDEDDGIEFRVFCDKSNVTLTCGSGWWHQKGEEYDLCTAEYDKLPVAEKKQYVEVTTPEDLGEVGKQGKRLRCCLCSVRLAAVCAPASLIPLLDGASECSGRWRRTW